ncbi:putative DNA-binding protein [Alloactinosynnema sp. L-07]|uniref:helix-turn-helix domain-containing protein n=1 Tax=Alloactinosynnema sp. L-07 TaxID=1653480 RepID=UPI00065EEF79|nr:helix-turn-helix transcriptional regulator [Alloactinosynnema sp. L-07]CRK61571.1 putative DNA-binding protein [Alloactinosynnema sp. L-07]
MNENGTARMRGLAAELKALRKESELTTLQVAQRSGFSGPVLNRMENALREVTSEEVATLLAIYGIKGKERERLLDLARRSREPWVEVTVPRASRRVETLANFEAEATHIAHGSMLRVPGLLQTADYMRTIAMISGAAPARVEDVVKGRLARQRVLVKRSAPSYLAIIDEMALRRRAGSDELMADQIQHILNVNELPNVDVRVIPFDHGVHPGLTGPYIMMDFAKGDAVMRFDHLHSWMFLDNTALISKYREMSDTLLRVAFPSAETVKFLRRLEAEFRVKAKRNGSWSHGVAEVQP